MAATNHGLLTFLERCRVSLPPNTVGERTLTLTFMDLPCLSLHPSHQIYFYEFPHSTTHFIQTLISNLKHSLSITLQHFFPFAGNLVMFPDVNKKKPEIRHAEGDSVTLTFAESSLDFGDLVGNHPRECNKFHLLLPQLECPSKVYDLTKFPLFAVQVTIFPHSGISIGLAYHHILCDANSSNDFLKAWTSIMKNCGLDEVFLASRSSLPFYDKSIIKYPTSLDEIYMANNQPWIQILEKKYQPRGSLVTRNHDKVHATFHLTRTQIDFLKKWVLGQLPDLEYVSSFVVGCAYVWICIAKSRIGKKEDDESDEEIETFLCLANLRAILSVPKSYFGNCVGPCIATAKRTLLTGNKGFPTAVEVLVKCIRESVNNKQPEDVLKDAETWLHRFTSLQVPTVSVTGSPKYNVYDIDFGWGKPKKHEVIMNDNAVMDVISVDASRTSPQDLEFGLSLCANQMNAFISIFENQMRTITSLTNND